VIADHLIVILLCCTILPVIANAHIYPVFTPNDYPPLCLMAYPHAGLTSPRQWQWRSLVPEAVELQRGVEQQESGPLPEDAALRQSLQHGPVGRQGLPEGHPPRRGTPSAPAPLPAPTSRMQWCSRPGPRRPCTTRAKQCHNISCCTPRRSNGQAIPQVTKRGITFRRILLTHELSYEPRTSHSMEGTATH